MTAFFNDGTWKTWFLKLRDSYGVKFQKTSQSKVIKSLRRKNGFVFFHTYIICIHVWKNVNNEL